MRNCMNTEKEWWRESFNKEFPGYDFSRHESFLEETLAEQRRRDWEEFREMVKDQLGEKWAGRSVVESYLLGEIDSKLAELNKPKE